MPKVNEMQNCSGFPESDLVHAARQGSHEAFTELLRRSRPRLLYAATAILKNPDDAEDAVQSASWKAWEHLPRFRGDSSFNTWLTSIAVNQARMRRRQRRRAQLLFDDAPDASDPRLRDAAPSAEESLAGDQLLRLLHREIRRLPAQLRHVMLLHVESLPISEVARRLGVSLVAAKARLFRARVMLRQQMRQCLGLPAVAA